MRAKSEPPDTLQVPFDATPEIFATDSGGSFLVPLETGGEAFLDVGGFDEMRFLFSVWHPSPRRTIDLDRAYVELRGRVDPKEEHWMKLAEIEPVVPAYAGGEAFDGWLLLPVLAPRMAFSLFGSGFESRARLQARAYLYCIG